MFVCKICHEKDVDAIGCKLSFNEHVRITKIFYGECEICGNFGRTVQCTKYTESKIKSTVPFRCPKCMIAFTCSTLRIHGQNSTQVRLCNTYRPMR